VPRVALPPVTLFTCQLTPVSVVSVTVAVKACVAVPARRVALVGETDTATGDATATVPEQAFGPALAGAEVVAAVAEMVTVAASARFGSASSSTVSVTVNEPLVGAVIVVAVALALDTG